ncbi:hypothetical protein HDU79_006606 [Rhizoclosmatium sp. JEL0117]|nr:hypothetical protein HDU79_006606 [Rhizoclosmatium sp. JEL0117]
MNPPPYKGPTSCTRCRSLKRKCSFAPGSIICDYCLKRETECIVPPSNPIKSCRRCYKHRKRCEPGDTACKRCTDLGVEDECVYFDQVPTDNRDDPLIMSPNTLAILDDLVSFDFPFITPPRVSLMVAVNAMTAEMQEVAETGVRKNVDGKDNGLETIEIGLKSISLGVEVESGLNENPILEPKALLGLLGMELGGNIRWKGRKEESWRLFWKLHN